VKLTSILKNKDVLGWLIWALVTLLLIGPCIYFIYLITYDTASMLVRIVAGVFSAAILSGFLTWLGNEIWFRLNKRRYEARRKKARKARKKKI